MTGRLIAMGMALIFLIAAEARSETRAQRDEHRCLALALYWEARGEPHEGKIAVGWTILNRERSPDFPSSVCGVVFDGGETPPCQFSWWCDGKSDRPRDRNSWIRSQVVAARLLTDPPPDPTLGALFFHSTSISVPWVRPRTRTARIGNHIFYR